jgi:hypothetical protein
MIQLNPPSVERMNFILSVFISENPCPNFIGIEIESILLLFYFFYNFGGVAGDDGVGRDVFGHHTAGADDGAFADGDAAHDGRIGADGGAFFNNSWNDLPVLLCGC